METALQDNVLAREQNARITLAKGTLWGLLGGLAGTLTIDLILMGVLSLAGLPAFTCFVIVGDTVARLFSLLGTEITGGVPLGVLTHYLIGPLIGAIFGAAVASLPALRVSTLKKCVILAVLYVEVASQPLLAMSVFLLEMKSLLILEWYGGALVMHFILAIILGVMVSRGLRLGF